MLVEMGVEERWNEVMKDKGYRWRDLGGGGSFSKP